MILFIHLLDLLGIAAFAATGALLASKRGMDIFGGLVLAFATGIGGGTMRDVILNVPVFWLTQADYIYACLVGFFLVYFFLWKFHDAPKATISLLDTVGLAMFSIIGAQKTLALGLSPIVAVMMGILTSCGGGMLRDVLANEVPMILTRKKLYATASLVGAVLFVLLAPLSVIFAIITAFTVVMIIRLGALFGDWRLPFFPK